MPSRSPSSGDDGETTKNSSFLKSKKPESEVEDSEAPQSGGEDEEDGDEEYEIEAILDAKKGQFGKNKMGYFVKWKGYGPEHNSWVAEDDAGNATELIKAFNEKKKSPKKALEPKRSRKSMGDDVSDADGSASAAKKRGRKSVSEKPADKEDDERPTKKPRKTAEKKTDAPKTTSAEPLPDEEVGTMEEHMQAPTWDQLIKKIDTVERVDDTLFVYFTLNGGERIREDSKICADKFPKMLIEFYESNLRWYGKIPKPRILG
ncbi:hypothetical protein K438DRAFT_1616598 [Mycena galopus ATCC 62051]|nr:hypothetical protein K438DRAFT_1616598 [Mycena galopus ATCC 62051]